MLRSERPEKPKKVYVIPKVSKKRAAAIEAGDWKPKEKKPIKPNKIKIALVSKTRQEALKTYRKRRDKYFEENPICEFPGCNSRDITLHHKRGRVGAFLTDKRHFCSLCLPHHIWVNENPKEAEKINLVHSRLFK